MVKSHTKNAIDHHDYQSTIIKPSFDVPFPPSFKEKKKKEKETHTPTRS